jgi:hypothetical protein
MGPRAKLRDKEKGVGRKGVLRLKHIPTSWDKANEVNPKHFQMGIALGIRVLKCRKSLGKYANNKNGSNWAANISFEKFLNIQNVFTFFIWNGSLELWPKEGPIIKFIV